jgi:toxin ParE1/3/4
MKIVWTPRFQAHLRREFGFLRERNPAAAVSEIQRVINVAQRLEQFPNSGRAWRAPGRLELVVPGSRYVVVYRIRDDAIDVLALLHTSRKLPPLH